MRLFKINQLIGVEVRFPNGKDWNSERDFEYYREAIILDEAENI